MPLKTFLFFVAGLLALSSCSDLFDENNLKPDGSKPSVMIISPTNNQAISKNDGLHIAVSAVDKDEFKAISFTIAGAKDAKEHVKFNKAEAKSRLAFDTVIAVNALKPGAYTLLINAIDKRTNQATQEVKFSVR
ncbi:Ig-like domain-containing protein [Pontibacter arcticus]|uniref:DUF4625 domain-containing protein n=1 Tax=Pontibacter arcticus TaxID=2080288 RepID=A0A364RBP9_9BACT|nr:Ig-like domain-containing protein [Pontibacter arcticus]RAU81722.1 hypothetical protein DP923_13540 [Pontibacter arcticus]